MSLFDKVKSKISKDKGLSLDDELSGLEASTPPATPKIDTPELEPELKEEPSAPDTTIKQEEHTPASIPNEPIHTEPTKSLEPKPTGLVSELKELSTKTTGPVISDSGVSAITSRLDLLSTQIRNLESKIEYNNSESERVMQQLSFLNEKLVHLEAEHAEIERIIQRT